MLDLPVIPPHLLSSIPTSAIPISPPDLSNTSSTTSTRNRDVKAKSNIPSFPPSSGMNAGTTSGATRKSSSTSMSLSSNVSDLLLSSLLPPNLPKLPASVNTSASAHKKGRNQGVPRELTTQRENFSLPLVSNNFRRFVTRVGPIFWLMDRVEEVLFWRKPIWTWAYMMVWTFICFQPRALLILPSLVLILILLHIHEKNLPLESLLGISIPASTITDRKYVPPSPDPSKPSVSASSASNTNHGSTGSYSTTKDSEGETIEKIVVPPKETESSVDVYMNIQAIQNLMGLVSDGYDVIAPRLSTFQSPNQPISPSTLPITFTHLILVALPATLLLPLTPSYLIPYILLPLGIAPPLLFHPNLTPFILSLPSHPITKKIRSYIEEFLLDDKLSDEIGRSKISKVEVWENERLDPKLSIGTTTSNSSSSSSSSNSTLGGSLSNNIIPLGSWSSKNLRASDKSPWIKVSNENTKWNSIEDNLPLPSSSSSTSTENTNTDEKDKQAKMILALKTGWEYIPNEDWRINLVGLWSDKGVDDEGWQYTDDSWQNPAPTPYTEAETPLTDKNGNVTVGTMPGLALRRTTRRRRWWRRVYEVSNEV
ncbi:uncharacterized protein L201_001907 [Kwoniella dendrophila CBS 6074]|uniref:TECPR1-like DysF domain-containing protein n=1 Tax=Kwoniella dendrophila CBS 6074 TaxID=1295534 RepID=A0AAX4JQM5_9TREE